MIADDLTGAADTGVQLTRAGYRTAVMFREADPPIQEFDAVSFDTDSRTLPAGFAARRVVEAGHAARDARIVYKKIDSTLRGPVAAELSAALGATRRRSALVAPAFPAAARTTVGGVQLVHGVPVHETEMRNDVRTPVREGYVPTLLSKAFSSIVTLSVEDLEDPERVRRALAESECVVADAERDADLEALARAVPEPSAVLWTGSAGLALALGAVYPGPRARDAADSDQLSAPVRSVLVVIGSMHEASRRQLRRLVEEYGEIAIEVGGSGVEEAVAAAREVLSAGGCAVIHSPGTRQVSGGGTSLAEVAGALAEGDLFDALVLTGGSTAVRVARRLGASGIRLEGEVESGVPAGTLLGPAPYRVVTKAGGFGGPDTLVGAVRALSWNEEDRRP